MIVADRLYARKSFSLTINFICSASNFIVCVKDINGVCKHKNWSELILRDFESGTLVLTGFVLNIKGVSSCPDLILKHWLNLLNLSLSSLQVSFKCFRLKRLHISKGRGYINFKNSVRKIWLMIEKSETWIKIPRYSNACWVDSIFIWRNSKHCWL